MSARFNSNSIKSTFLTVKDIRIIIIALLWLGNLGAFAQVGEHRSEVTVGVGAGVAMNTVSFMPTVNQKMKMGKTGGVMIRYKSEKYFSTICSVLAEVNYTELGWKEDILSPTDMPVPVDPLDASKGFQSYERNIRYIQVPLMAHLAWGKESKGFNFFFNAGPQFGYAISESSVANLAYKTDDNGNRVVTSAGRVSGIVAQYDMPVENKFDYGITAGLGIEVSIKHFGRLQLAARYYYGLGNIYGDSKRDYFGTSSNQTITVKFGYLVDL